MIIPDSTFNSVLCISTKGEDGKKYILGSGFGYSICHRKLKEGKFLRIHYLITNKHVIENYKKIIISFGNSCEKCS